MSFDVGVLPKKKCNKDIVTNGQVFKTIFLSGLIKIVSVNILEFNKHKNVNGRLSKEHS